MPALFICEARPAISLFDIALLLELTAEVTVPILVGPPVLPAVAGPVFYLLLLLLSIWVKMSLVYLSLLVISAFCDSRARFNGRVDLSPFLFTYVTSLLSEFSSISVWSWKFTYTILLLSLNMIACLVLIHFFT